MKHVLFFTALLSVLLATSYLSASEWSPKIAADCASSFPERHTDAMRALSQHTTYMLEYSSVMPWFDQNCRHLSELERAVRKVDDPAAFVCRTQKGRPKQLTSQFVLEHSQPVDVVLFQERFHDDDVCEQYDAAERVSLVLREPPPERKLAVYCYGSLTAQCDRVRQVIAAAATQKGAVSP